MYEKCTIQQKVGVLRLTGFTEIGRALLVPVGGGTHQESRNNGDRLEPWKGHPATGRKLAQIQRGIAAASLAAPSAAVHCGGRERPFLDLNGRGNSYDMGVEAPERQRGGTAGRINPAREAGTGQNLLTSTASDRKIWKGRPAAGQNPARSGVTGSDGNLFTSTALRIQRARERPPAVIFFSRVSLYIFQVLIPCILLCLVSLKVSPFRYVGEVCAGKYASNLKLSFVLRGRLLNCQIVALIVYIFFQVQQFSFQVQQFFYNHSYRLAIIYVISVFLSCWRLRLR